MAAKLIFDRADDIGEWVAQKVEQSASWGDFYAMGAQIDGQIVTGSFPVSVLARRVGETTTPAAWATFTLQVQAVSVALV